MQNDNATKSLSGTPDALQNTDETFTNEQLNGFADDMNEALYRWRLSRADAVKVIEFMKAKVLISNWGGR